MQITPLEVGEGGGKKGSTVVTITDSSALFYYNLLFWLIKAQLLLNLFRKIELILRK